MLLQLFQVHPVILLTMTLTILKAQEKTLVTKVILHYMILLSSQDADTLLTKDPKSLKLARPRFGGKKR